MLLVSLLPGHVIINSRQVWHQFSTTLAHINLGLDEYASGPQIWKMYRHVDTRCPVECLSGSKILTKIGDYVKVELNMIFIHVNSLPFIRNCCFLYFILREKPEQFLLIFMIPILYISLTEYWQQDLDENEDHLACQEYQTLFDYLP